MRIELNGSDVELPAGATLADAVRAARRAPRGPRRSPSPSTARSSRAASGTRRRSRRAGRVEVLAAIQGGAETWELGGR